MTTTEQLASIIDDCAEYARSAKSIAEQRTWFRVHDGVCGLIVEINSIRKLIPKWQPIETAPKDGSRIIVANNKYFSPGQWHVEIESDTDCRGFPEGKGFGQLNPDELRHALQLIPNPKAGSIKYAIWWIDNPCSFLKENEQCPDYDCNFDGFEPTHWMPLPEPPADLQKPDQPALAGEKREG